MVIIILCFIQSVPFLPRFIIFLVENMALSFIHALNYKLQMEVYDKTVNMIQCSNA